MTWEFRSIWWAIKHYKRIQETQNVNFQVVQYSGYVQIEALHGKDHFLGLKAIAMLRGRGKV